MSGFTYELRKILFHQKGLFYIVLVLLVSSLLLGISDNPNNSAMEQYRNEYNWYLEKVNGQCTNEKALFLEEEARIINEASGKIDNLLDSYYAGEISESEYNKGSEENNKILENKNGFEVIYQQYLYICENDANRYFLQTNGWAGLLGGGTLNFLLFIGILLLVTPVFCSEYSCQMDALILTSKEGRKSSIYKMLIIGVGVLFMCMSISLIEYGFYSIKYGLPNGDYPIQSLAYFANSSKSISLFEGYIYITMLRCFGGIFLAVLLMFMSVVVKKYALTLLVGAVSVLIPYVGLQKTMIYRLPLPLPFLLGTDFFAGETVSSDAWSGEDLIVFAEVDITTIYTLLIVSMVLCILAIVWILRCNSNNWLMKARKHRKMASVALVLCLVLALAGCSNETGNQTVVSNSGATYDSLKYEIIKDPETQVLYLKDTTTGETMNLVRDPLFGTLSEENRVISYYVSSPYIYYTTLITEHVVDRVGVYNSNVTTLSVVELNLDTFAEKVIFEQVTNSGRSILGIEYDAGDKWTFLVYHNSFFLNDDSLFFVGNNGITEVDRNTKRITNVDIHSKGGISFDGKSIFYINNQSVLARYDVSSKSTTQYENIIAYDFCIDEQSIYYISRTDSSYVYCCDKDGSNKELISETPAISISCDRDSVSVLPAQGDEQIIFSKNR